MGSGMAAQGLECFAKPGRGARSEVSRSEVEAGLEASRPEWLTMPEVLPDAVHKVWD